MSPLSHLHSTEEWLHDASQSVGNLAGDFFCAKPTTAAFGALAFTGCTVARGLGPIPQSHALSHAGSDEVLRQSGVSSSSSAAGGHDWLSNLPFTHLPGKHRGSVDGGFLDTSFRRGMDIDIEEEQVVERAEDAIASTHTADKDIRTAVETSEEAAMEGLTAAQVCLYTELVATVGAFAGILTSWIGWKMDDSHLPEQMQVPEVGSKQPRSLMQPPPGTRVGAGRMSTTADRARTSLRPGSNGAAASSSGSRSSVQASSPATAPAGPPAAEEQGDDF